MVLSHAHPDHELGLLAVAGEIPVTELWLATGENHQLARAVAARGGRVRRPVLERQYRLGAVQLRTLWPVSGRWLAPREEFSVNDNSLVVEVLAHGRRILLSGDIERAAEVELQRRLPHPVDILKVAHHGSRTSSTAELLAVLRPSWAIVSCGTNNRFGFPHRATLDTLLRAGAAVLRTDIDGAVSVDIGRDGELSVTHYRR